MKMHGWNLTSIWTRSFEQKLPASLRKISSSSLTIQCLEKTWRTSETGWISDSERMINKLKSLFRNRIMNERQSSMKILLQCIWKKWNLLSTRQFILGCQSSIFQKLWCKIFIITSSRKSMDQKRNCSWLIRILWFNEIHTEDFFEDIREDIKKKFDTSNFENSKLPRLNKKVPGMFKDEAGGKIVSEFVGLRA